MKFDAGEFHEELSSHFSSHLHQPIFKTTLHKSISAISYIMSFNIKINSSQLNYLQ